MTNNTTLLNNNKLIFANAMPYTSRLSRRLNCLRDSSSQIRLFQRIAPLMLQKYQVEYFLKWATCIQVIVHMSPKGTVFEIFWFKIQNLGTFVRNTVYAFCILFFIQVCFSPSFFLIIFIVIIVVYTTTSYIVQFWRPP